jgi:acetylornithine deacetylase/succinyl-diaminopimelate desuccinylase-like protein
MFKKIVASLLLYYAGAATFVGFSQNVAYECTAIYKDSVINIEEVLSKYVQFQSVSGNEKEAGAWLKSLCLENGFYITQMGSENGNYNFAASLYPLSQKLPNIIFLNHIDVVPVGDKTSWQFPPFSGTIENGELWGRGAFDNKGNAVMQLFSMLAIKNKYVHSQLPYNVTFLAVSSEETQADGGVNYVVDNFLNELNPAVVIGEGPPGLVGILDENSKIPLFSISLVHKRALWLALELNIETSGHGSVTPQWYATKEMNLALHKLLKKQQKAIYTDLNVAVLKQLGAFKGGFQGWVLKHPKFFKPLIVSRLRKKPELFSLFSNTITLTGFESNSEAINVIPNKVSAYLDCRLLPNTSQEIFLAEVLKKLDNQAIKVSVLQAMPEVEISDCNSKYYKSIVNSLKLAYPEGEIIKTLLPNFNDVGAFRKAGVQGFAYTPVVLDKKFLESIHNVNERIPVSILRKGQEAYMFFIDDLLKE